MRLTLLQPDIRWGDIRANLDTASGIILGAGSDSSMFVLPETFSTGFVTNPEALAERHGETRLWAEDMARRTGAAIVVGAAVEEGGRWFNRLYFVTPDGVAATYDKRHLFTYASEHLHYTRGHRRTVVEWGGVRFLLQICYDLRFPVFSRCNDDYDAIIYVASWPQGRRRVWDALLPARAIENQAYVLGVNRVGNDPACGYNGGTCAIDPFGNTMALCPDGTPSTVTVDIDIEALRTFRNKFPALADRDRF